MRFPFISMSASKGQASFMPYMPINLSYQQQTFKTIGLLDTGAAVNVLPYSVGYNLGIIWSEQTVSLQLGGNLAAFEAKAVFLDAFIEDYPVVQLAFAWSKSDRVPLLLGQTNFFMNFDVFFSRSSLFLKYHPKVIQKAPN
jgi:hypothetical protein